MMLCKITSWKAQDLGEKTAVGDTYKKEKSLVKTLAQFFIC